jgi:hypothetical protein
MPDESLETTTSYAEVSACAHAKTSKMHLKKNPDLFCRQDAPQEKTRPFLQTRCTSRKTQTFFALLHTLR